LDETTIVLGLAGQPGKPETRHPVLFLSPSTEPLRRFKRGEMAEAAAAGQAAADALLLPFHIEQPARTQLEASAATRRT
jgi:hypothetical protein